MRWNDLREYIDKMRELGEITDVPGAHWDLEIGVITELIMERGGPALLFDEIPGYPKGFRILCNVGRSAHLLGHTLGLDGSQTLTGMAEEWDRASKDYKLIPPEVRPTGPVMENVMTGPNLDLLKFPSPKWHDQDGDRYIGTGCCVILKDPETGLVNVGTYRVAVHDEKTAKIFINSSQGDGIRRKYWNRGEKAPVIVSCGQEPILTGLSGGTIMDTPDNVSELEVAGYLQGAPYPVVLGPVTGIPMPATAEIVIEGYIPSPDEGLLPEGPFGEWTGYYAHGRRPETPIEISAIYYRNDPILYGMPPVRPISADHRLAEVDLDTKRKLEKAGIPGIQGIVNWGVSPYFKIVSIQQMYDEHLDDVMRVLDPGGSTGLRNRIWVLVDDDIDIFNTQEVLWAMSTRLIPHSGVHVIQGMGTMQLDPRIPPEQRSDPSKGGRKPYRADNLILNACRPYEWKDDFPKVNVNSRELRQSVEQKWKHLFIAL